ncbi:hypothetical protein L0F63_000475 [Massospora cicadina]|nr:hypothetical protein L0F63_000475 [Massospora cicadina]
MATMAQPIKSPPSPFSPSQLEQDIEIRESHVEGLDENEVLNHRLKSATTVNADLAAQLEFLKKGLQAEFQSALQSQTKLEKQYYGIEAELEKAKIAGGRNFSAQREESFRSQIKALQSQLQQKGRVSPTTGRVARARSVSVNFSPPAYLAPPDILSDDGLEATEEATLIHEAKLANRTVRQQLKEIGTLKATISQLNAQLASQTAQEAVTSNRIKLLQAEVERLTLANSTHMEEIESYQLLLEDRTLRGQFSLNRQASKSSLMPEPSFYEGFNLGSELSQAQTPTHAGDGVSTMAKDELRQLKDENKALALYINKILAKIMSNPVLAEAITHNGDASTDQAKAEAPIEPVETRAEEANHMASRSAGPLATTFGLAGVSSGPEVNHRVSFDLPAPRPEVAPSRNSTDSTDQTPSRGGNGGQSSFRSRRTKSMSVPSLPDTKEPSSGGFSFRTALKRMAGPWKSAPKPGSEGESGATNSISEASKVSPSQ